MFERGNKGVPPASASACEEVYSSFLLFLFLIEVKENQTWVQLNCQIQFTYYVLPHVNAPGLSSNHLGHRRGSYVTGEGDGTPGVLVLGAFFLNFVVNFAVSAS